jgi:hypothetical protein
VIVVVDALVVVGAVATIDHGDGYDNGIGHERERGYGYGGGDATGEISRVVAARKPRARCDRCRAPRAS